MEGRRIRLGSVIDDYCTRCRLIMNHGVVGMVGEEVKKVRCNTCLTEHLYKHGRLPKRRRDETSRLFDEVLKGLGRKGDEAPPEPRAGAADEVGEEPGAPAAAEAGADSEEPAGEGSPLQVSSPAGPSSAAAAAPEPEPLPTPTADEAAHGVRRKLYTIRRYSGGKPPGSGTPQR